jgi:hypothetical protein
LKDDIGGAEYETSASMIAERVFFLIMLLLFRKAEIDARIILGTGKVNDKFGASGVKYYSLARSGKRYKYLPQFLSKGSM